MRNWMTLPLCLLLAGCTAAAPGTAQTPAPTAAPQTLAVVLDGCIAFEADSAGGSLKTPWKKVSSQGEYWKVR